MKIIEKVLRVFYEAVPVIIMIGLIPFIANDYWLALVYIGICAVAFFIRYEKRDSLFFVFGLIIMVVAESWFLMAGVETFKRISLFGIMPIWLPILWAYGFVAIKRAINIIK